MFSIAASSNRSFVLLTKLAPGNPVGRGIGASGGVYTFGCEATQGQSIMDGIDASRSNAIGLHMLGNKDW